MGVSPVTPNRRVLRPSFVMLRFHPQAPIAWPHMLPAKPPDIQGNSWNLTNEAWSINFWRALKSHYRGQPPEFKGFCVARPLLSSLFQNVLTRPLPRRILSDSYHCVSHVFTEMDPVVSTPEGNFLEDCLACPSGDCYIDRLEHLIARIFTLCGREVC